MLEKLKRLSITDGLTKLYNSRYFYNQLKIEIDRTTPLPAAIEPAAHGYR